MQVSPCRAPAQSVKKEGSPTIEAGTGHAFKEASTLTPKLLRHVTLQDSPDGVFRFLEGFATATVARKLEVLCSRGFVTCYEVAQTEGADELNVAVRVKEMETSHHGTVEVVHLQLQNVMSEGLEARQPRTTGETLRFDSTGFSGKVQTGQVYMLVGARIKKDLGRRQCIVFPDFQECRASILLPSRTDAITTMVELFSGGMSSWAVASKFLPMEVAMRIDNDGLSVSNLILNDPEAILFSGIGDQATFNVFWGDPMDLRWLAGVHEKNIEIICASPPVYPFLADGDGLAGGKKALSWWQMFLLLRLTQRRVFILETLPRAAHHEDMKLIMDILRWCGYRCVWKGFIGASQHAAVERNRYCLIFWNTADHPAAGAFFKMVKVPSQNPMACHGSMWSNMPDEVEENLTIQGANFTKITSRDLLPQWQRRLPGSAFDIRLVDQSVPLPMVPSNYGSALDLPWYILQKKGLYLPVMPVGRYGARLISKWETLRCFGFPHRTILPGFEEDAYLVLADSLTPSQALYILVSVLGHRSEDPMGNDEMARFFLEGIQEIRDGWPSFDDVEPFDFEGWSILVPKGDQAERSIHGKLRNRLIAKKVQLDSLLFRRSQGQTLTLPEQTRVIYEDLKSEDEDEEGELYKLYHVTGGSSWITLRNTERSMEVHRQVAEFLAMPPEDMALAKMSQPTQDTENWILAGEIPVRYDVVLVLVDTALPEAHWLPTQLHWQNLRLTWSPHHSGEPDVITLNGKIISTWPAVLTSGDFLVLRWDGHSEAENANDLDIFKKFDEDQNGGDHHPTTPATADTLPATIPFDTSLDDTPAPMGTREEGSSAPDRGTPDGPCEERGYDKEMQAALHEDIPPTICYGPTRPTTIRHAIYVEFQGQLLPCNNGDPRTLEQVVQDEWGPPPGSVYFLLQGRWIGAGTTCSRIPTGQVVRVRGKLCGGTHGAMNKLHGLLKQKGVPEELLDERVEEIKNQIGERGIKDAYASFDPWSQLKASCSTRLVKEMESRHKPKAKMVQNDDDPLQTNDPWTAALRERNQWTLEASFFKTESGAHPTAITKITHGASGVALVTEREAELLLQNQEHMSEDELAALVIGTNFQMAGRFPIQEVEIPCRNQEDRRVLIKAQMINLGKKQISLHGEDKKIKVDELDGIILAAEIIKKEVPQWEDVVDGPLKYIKKQIPTLNEATFASWGRKFFLQGKPTQDAKNAESCFILLRIKRDYRDATLRVMIPGVYIAPRSADNGADPSFKVVWFADRPTSELAVLANSEPQAFGLVRSRSGYGIRVKADDYSRLKQKWQPSWQPLADTPYHLMMNMYFEVQNLPLSCSKVEVQKFLNQISWKSLAIRQVQPRILNLDRIQKRMDQMHAEQKSAHAILKEDFKAFQETVQVQNSKQEAVNLKLQQGLSDITSAIASQLNQNAVMITSALQQNRQEINQDIKSAQISLKEELMGEVKDQMSHLRKRTPSPQRSGELEEPKKQKDKLVVQLYYLPFLCDHWPNLGLKTTGIQHEWWIPFWFTSMDVLWSWLCTDTTRASLMLTYTMKNYYEKRFKEQCWNDAALVQQSRDGEEPKLTYKETSRIDYILFNRKALPAFLNFSVSAQAETDHKTVVAEFDWTALPTVRNVYKMPVNLDHLQLDKQRILDAYLPAAHRQALATALQAGDSCKAWDTFCEAYEATLEFLFAGEDDIHFGARFRGRGKLRFKKQQDQGPIRRARCGEFDPTGDEVSTTLRQRIRQIRRLYTYISQSRKLQQTAPDDIKWPALHNAVLATWSAIVRSSGFQGQFAHWWLREVGPAFPLHPPDSSQALWMYETMRDLEPQWRSACRKYRSHNIMQVFNQDWKQGASKHFSAVKPPGAPRVDSLDVFTPIHITACRMALLNKTETVGDISSCPVAVVQMILLTWTFTAFIGHKTGVQIYSYVDDWMMLTKQPGQLVVAIQSLNKLAKKFGLILSLPKSHVFSILTKTARAIRGNLIHHGISIGTAKNFQSLGINLQTTHKVTVDMRNKRWNRAKVLLNRLQYMPWDRRRKSAILVRGIFPLIFFGVQCWPTGKDFLREVRAKCNHTVWGKQQYHLHFTAPLFSGYNYEPMLLVAAMRFRAFMRLFVQHQTKAMEVWKYSIQQKAFFKNKTKGIVGLFQNQLHELDWAISPDGMCHTADGWSFCIWDITTAQFE
ncbi:unnamed protein product, partial [Symbiodinium microadriaticum]